MTQDKGFLAFEFATGQELATAPALVLGAPFETDGTRDGCRDAPDAIRRASVGLAAQYPVRGYDMGNLSTGEDWRPAVKAFIELSLRQGSMPIVIGGGADVAHAVMEAAGDHAVIVASHLLRPGLSGRRVGWLGLNGPQEASLWQAMIAGPHNFLTARQMDEGATVDLPEQALLWIDAAVLDTGHAAGAAEVNPGGLTPDTLVQAMAALKGRILGVVVTGATPARDPRGLTELVLASSVAEVMADG